MLPEIAKLICDEYGIPWDETATEATLNGRPVDAKFINDLFMRIKNKGLNMDSNNLICNGNRDIDSLIPYIDKPVYVRGYCWAMKFDGWVVIYKREPIRPVSTTQDLVFDYRGRTYSVFGFLPSEYIMWTDSTYNNAIYKEEPR